METTLITISVNSGDNIDENDNNDATEENDMVDMECPNCKVKALFISATKKV